MGRMTALRTRVGGYGLGKQTHLCRIVTWRQNRFSDPMATRLSHSSHAASRPTPALLALIAVMLFLAGCSTPSGTGKRKADFTHYDEPLYEQITNRIEARVMARLGKGENTHDRFFIIPYAYQNKGNDPAFSHSFLSVIRVYADGKVPAENSGFKHIELKGRDFEAFTISWLPADFAENPDLCVFDGVGAVVSPELNKCPAVPGKSFDLSGTLKLAVDAKVAVGMWGPYEISEPGFDLAVTRLRLLEKGEIKYRADDRGYRKRKEAINCFHAMQSLDALFPDGGFLDTGFLMWGLNGTKQVLREYTTSARDKGLLLEPVDIDKDVIGFVYAPERSAKGVYNPFYGASAYRK